MKDDEKLARMRERAKQLPRLSRIPGPSRTKEQWDQYSQAKYALDYVCEYDFAREVGFQEGLIGAYREILGEPIEAFPELDQANLDDLKAKAAELQKRISQQSNEPTSY